MLRKTTLSAAKSHLNTRFRPGSRPDLPKPYRTGKSITNAIYMSICTGNGRVERAEWPGEAAPRRDLRGELD